MTGKNSNNDDTQDDQLEFDFPSTDDFESFDDADSVAVEDELPNDSFQVATADFNTEGCGCVK